MYFAYEWEPTERKQTLFSAVAAIDGTTGSTSALFKMMAENFTALQILAVIDATGTTDALNWQLLGGWDNATAAPNEVMARTPIAEGTFANTTGSLTELIILPNIVVPFCKLKFLSAGATDTWTITATLRRGKPTDHLPVQRW